MCKTQGFMGAVGASWSGVATVRACAGGRSSSSLAKLKARAVRRGAVVATYVTCAGRARPVGKVLSSKSSFIEVCILREAPLKSMLSNHTTVDGDGADGRAVGPQRPPSTEYIIIG